MELPPLDLAAAVAQDGCMVAAGKRQLDLRFAVGSPDGPRSGVWRAIDYRSDVYVAPREIMDAVKISLHRDRNCLLKVNDEHWRRMAGWRMAFARRPAFARWTRPDSSAGTLATALLVSFPFESLAASLMRGDTSKIVWLPPPGKGEAVKVAFIFVRGVERTMEAQIGSPAHNLGYCHLDNGETVLVAARTMACDPERHFGWFRKGWSGPVNFLTPNQDVKNRELVRTMFHGEPPKSGTFEIFELAIRAKQASG